VFKDAYPARHNIRKRREVAASEGGVVVVVVVVVAWLSVLVEGDPFSRAACGVDTSAGSDA